MSDTPVGYLRSIDFGGRIPSGASIEFLRVEMPMDYYGPFVLVRYATHGREEKYGLRMDLDKQVFLDHFPQDKDKEEVLARAAPRICEFLRSALFQAR